MLIDQVVRMHNKGHRKNAAKRCQIAILHYFVVLSGVIVAVDLGSTDFRG